MTGKERMALMERAEEAVKTIKNALGVLEVDEFDNTLERIRTEIEYGWAVAYNDKVEEERTWQASLKR